MCNRGLYSFLLPPVPSKRVIVYNVQYVILHILSSSCMNICIYVYKSINTCIYNIYIYECWSKFLYPGSVILANKNYFSQTFAFLRFIFRRCTLYLCVPCVLYDGYQFCSRQWLLLYWQIRNKNFTACQYVSSTSPLTPCTSLLFLLGVSKNQHCKNHRSSRSLRLTHNGLGVRCGRVNVR